MKALNAAAGFRLIVTVFATEFSVAVNVAAVTDETIATLAVKLVELAPAGTVTEAGIVTAVELLAKLTASPPAGATAVRVTVQVSLPAAA